MSGGFLRRASRSAKQNERYRQHELLPETRSEAAIPLKIENTILGVLDVQSNQENYFDETDLVVLRALADNIAVAIEGARLYSSLRRRASQLSVIHEVSNAITSILDTEKLFDEVVSVIQKRFGYTIVHLFSVHPGRRKVFFEAGSSQVLHEELGREGIRLARGGSASTPVQFRSRPPIITRRMK